MELALFIAAAILLGIAAVHRWRRLPAPPRVYVEDSEFKHEHPPDTDPCRVGLPVSMSRFEPNRHRKKRRQPSRWKKQPKERRGWVDGA